MNVAKKLICTAALCLIVGTAFAEEGNAEAGAKVFKKCAACHSVDKPQNKVGPHLMGIVGRPVASLEDYKYSKPMIAFSEGEKVWDEAALSEYLRNPRAIVKGTKMAFVGLKKDADVADIVAYLKTFPAP